MMLLPLTDFSEQEHSTFPRCGGTTALTINYGSDISHDAQILPSESKALSGFGEGIAANSSVEKPITLPAAAQTAVHTRSGAGSKVKKPMFPHAPAKKAILMCTFIRSSA